MLFFIALINPVEVIRLKPPKCNSFKIDSVRGGSVG